MSQSINVGTELLSPTTTTSARPVKPNRGDYPSRMWLIQPQGANIRWSDDKDFALSSSSGMEVADGDTLIFQGDFTNWRCIASSGTPTVVVQKYSGGC